MKKRERTTLCLAMLLGAVLALAIFPSWVRAETTDTDADGLINEAPNGITPTGAAQLPLCPTSGTYDRAKCVDPNKLDLFVILMKTASTLLKPTDSNNIPINWLEFISKVPMLTSAGVSLYGVHELVRTLKAGKKVTSTQSQYAVRVFEDSTSALDSNVVLAITYQGTPNDPDDITVYTKRIDDFVATKCAGKNCINAVAPGLSCLLNDPNYATCLANLKTIYKKQVIAHETGHKTWLTKAYNSNYGGYHYQTGSRVNMDQAVYYTTDTTTNTVTWYIPNSYQSLEVPRLK